MKGKSLLFGLLSGALLGVLFAPDAGKKLREKFKQERKKGGTGIDTLKKSFIDLGNDVWETVEDFSENVQEDGEETGEFEKKKISKSPRKSKTK